MFPADSPLRPVNTTPQKEFVLHRRRRGDLVEATIAEIAEHGLASLTLARVAGRAGMTVAMVSFHFASKDALLVATLHSLYEEYEAAIDRALEERSEDPGAALEALVALHFDPLLSDPRRVSVWYAFWGEARARTDYMAICGARDVDQERQLLELCRAVIERDGCRQLAPEAIAAGLSGLLEETWQCFLVDDGPAVRAERRRLCTAYLVSVFPDSFGREAASAPLPAPHPDRATALDGPDQDRGGLPPWTYVSPELTALEKQQLFRRNWLLVGHESEAPNVGDYLTFDAVDERALIVRGKDGRLRAFHNLCRHRASKVLTERQGRCKHAMVCPFHGWSYGLDGSLRGLPAPESFGALDKARFGLKPLDLEIWHGFVFLRFGGEGSSVAALMAPAEAELAPYRLAELQPLGRYWQRHVALDWKTVHDVDNEGYHVPKAHPGLHRLVGASYYDEVIEEGLWRSFSELQDKASPNWSEELYRRLLPEAGHLPESHRRAWLYYGLQPNLSVAFYPDQVDFFQAFPIAPGRSLMRGRSYALPSDERAMKAARWLNARINRNVAEEDNDIAAWSAAGQQSSGFEGIVLSDKEVGVRALHDVIRKAIPVARLDEAPALGTIAEVNRRMGG